MRPKKGFREHRACASRAEVANVQQLRVSRTFEARSLVVAVPLFPGSLTIKADRIWTRHNSSNLSGLMRGGLAAESQSSTPRGLSNGC